MISKRKMDSRNLLALFMNGNMEILDSMDDPKYEKLFLENGNRTIHLINELMNQICEDQAKCNMRSAFRKAVLLNKILKKVINTGDE